MPTEVPVAVDGVCTGQSVPWLMWYTRPSMGPVADEHMVSLRGGPITECGKEFEGSGVDVAGHFRDLPEQGVTICPSCVDEVSSRKLTTTDGRILRLQSALLD